MEPPVSERAMPSTLYIAFTDIFSATGMVLPFVFILIALIVSLVDGVEQALGAIAMGVLGVLIGFPIAWWRIHHNKETLARGNEVDGVVTQIKWGRRSSGNTRVKWQYQVDGKLYEGEAYVSSSGEVRPPEQGRKIHLLVHPTKPGWSLWRDLYTTALALGKN